MSTANTISPLLRRMIEDMTARNLGHHTQRSHIYSCKRFAFTHSSWWFETPRLIDRGLRRP